MVMFRPLSQHDLAPAGGAAKVAANVAALTLLRQLQDDDRRARPQEQKVLARWSGWGSVPKVFEEDSAQFASERGQLRVLLDDQQWRAASRTTLNAHYTDAAIARAMWQFLSEAGFGADGPTRVLEPGCGAGTFLGLSPETGVELIGVELDPTTAAIAQHLYPRADIRAESFALTRLPAGSLDLVIGNVPFGKIALHDPVHNAGGHSLHNYFIVKSLALTRPGGVVAVLTSHYTMDATNPAARREIAEMADLVAAIRLPAGAHQRAAGTAVITDVLVLRRRDPADGPGDGSSWESTINIAGPSAADAGSRREIGDPAADAGRQVPVNRYFTDHPERVIGAIGTRLGQFGPELHVEPAAGVDVAAELSSRLQSELRGAASAASTASSEEPSAAGDGSWTLFGARRAAASPSPVLRPDAPAQTQQDHLTAVGDGTFLAVDQGLLVPHPVPTTQATELTALLGLRDTTMALLTAEAANAEDTDQLAELRGRVNSQYDAYAKRWGPINRISTRRTGRLDETTGAERLARISPPQGRFRIDPHSPAVYALEEFDATTGTARKAPIMSGRVVAPRVPRLGADSPADAVAICLDTHGEVRLEEVARLLGRSLDETLQALDGLVFTDPSPSTGSHPALETDAPMAPVVAVTRDRLVPGPEYLSGNVRVKLAAAEAAAERDAADPAVEDGGRRWDANIAALREVIPVDLTPAEIDARLGASWIDALMVQTFLRDILADPTILVEHPGGSTWAVRGGRHSVLSCSTWGTQRAPATDLVASLLEQRPIRVTDEVEPGKRVLNLTETVAAQEKATVLAEKFSDWVWSDPDRARALARRYNDMFNSIALRSYDGAQTQRMALPGLTVTFTPRDHQRAAVARIVSEPSVLLAHEVGAGKTAEIVIGAHELRRLGMADKPAVVVPNHMLEQFTREWLQLYPRARILATSIDELAAGKRRQLIARIATGNWDAVIVSRSAFERMPLSIREQQRYLDNQLTEMRRQLSNAKGGHGLTVKRLEGSLARAEERLKKLTDTAKDPGITFEQTGIDYLFVDEAHGYKNLRTVSNIPGVGSDGSGRATDLDMKLDYLRGRHGERVATFATATPIANSVAEAYTMQRFLRPDLLRDAGLTDFDSWAATFAEVTTDLELAPDGSRFRMASRFAKFRNVPELLRMWHVSADIKTAQDLQLPTPALRGGVAETVVVPATDELAVFMTELSGRADRVQNRSVGPEEDNMLKIATHGRMAALDLRLLGRDPGPDPGQHTKLAAAASRIAAIHHANAGRRYPDSRDPPAAGSLQIVFCDLGTPAGRRNSSSGPSTGAGRWTAYYELKALLVARGVPAQKIRYVHEARNDKEKGELFAAARSGQVAVLIGSTEKMGIGTNVQARVVALHHLDCPWRPADLAQREGRILRQGNLNSEVEILRYVSEGSFDAYLWQTCERKARFIGQLMRGRLDVREIDDVGDTALSYSEVKALATGDSRILEKARVDAEMTRLERLERAHTRNQRMLSATITDADTELPKLLAERHLVEDAMSRRVDTTGDKFTMQVAGAQCSSRADAAIALRFALAAIEPAPEHTGLGQPVILGSLGGFTVAATAQRYLQPHLSLELVDVPRSSFTVSYDELRADKPLGIITRLENKTHDLDRTHATIAGLAANVSAEADRARADYGQPFTHRQALLDARTRSAELAAELAEPDRHPPAATNGSAAKTTTAVTAMAASGGRWADLIAANHPSVVTDPHWDALAAQLDRIHAAGSDVAALVAQVTSERALPDDHPARSLDYRLAEFTPTTPATTQVAVGTPGSSDRSPGRDSLTGPTPSAGVPPAGPTTRTGPGR